MIITYSPSQGGISPNNIGRPDARVPPEVLKGTRDNRTFVGDVGPALVLSSAC